MLLLVSLDTLGVGKRVYHLTGGVRDKGTSEEVRTATSIGVAGACPYHPSLTGPGTNSRICARSGQEHTTRETENGSQKKCWQKVQFSI